jgi:ABC-2 type transport system permease protein
VSATRRLSGFLERLLALSLKELLHIVRDRQVIYLALGMPVVMVLIFGYAVTFDVDGIRLAIVDQDRSPASRRLIEAMTSSGTFQVARRLESADEVERLFRRDEVKAALVIPPDFSRQLLRGGVARYQLLVDGSNGTSAQIALGYAAEASQRETLAALERAGLQAGIPLEGRVQTWFNPGVRSAFYVVPGLVAIIIGVLCVLLSTLTVAREWERGSMEQLFATPVGRLSVVLGKMLPYVLVGVIQTLLVLVAGAWLFEVPVRGSLLLLFAATLLFLVCVLGQGFLISVVTKNQQVATQAGAVSAMLPALLLSGFLFPVENMPTLLQGISYAVPTRYMISILRGILLQGRGVAELWPPLLGLAALALAMVTLSTLKFRRRLD